MYHKQKPKVQLSQGGKEMKRLRSKLAKATAVVLALLMVMSIIPPFSMTVEASPYAGNPDNITSENRAYVNQNWHPRNSVRRISAWLLGVPIATAPAWHSNMPQEISDLYQGAFMRPGGDWGDQTVVVSRRVDRFTGHVVHNERIFLPDIQGIDSINNLNGIPSADNLLVLPSSFPGSPTPGVSVTHPGHGWPQMFIRTGTGLTGGAVNSWREADILIIYITNNIVATGSSTSIGRSILDLYFANRTVIIRSCPIALAQSGQTEPFYIRAGGGLAGARHFTVLPNATLILYDVILCGGTGFNLGQIIPGGSVGGVQVNTPGALAGLFTDGGALYMMQGSTIRNTRGNWGGAVSLQDISDWQFFGSSNTYFTMFPGATITNAGASGGGGGVFGGADSIMRLAGNITHNSAMRSFLDDSDLLGVRIGRPNGVGGGVLSVDGYVTLRGGRIANNMAQTWGGGVAIEDDDGFLGISFGNATQRFWMHGGTIEHNSVPSYTATYGSFNWSPVAHIPQDGFGGGVVIRNADFRMFGGVIQHNRAVYGGGVYLRGNWDHGFDWIGFAWGSNAAMRMMGGYIQNNVAMRHVRPIPRRAGYGGGIRADVSSHFHMYNGTIQNNHARRGGGISSGDSTPMYGVGQFGINPGQITQNGGVIRNNRAELDGGGIHLAGGRLGLAVAASITRFDMNSGVIQGNMAGRNGGGIFSRDGARLYLGWGETGRPRAVIDGNIAGSFGGGVWVDVDSCFRAQHVNIHNNFAGRDGGGIFMRTFLYHYWMSSGAYDLNGSGSNGVAFRTDMHFTGNRAGNGWSFPPINAATFGNSAVDPGVSRMPLASSLSITFQEQLHPYDALGRNTIPHQLNNFDINHHSVGGYDDGNHDHDDDPHDRSIDMSKELRIPNEEPGTPPGNTNHVPIGHFTFDAELVSIDGNTQNLPDVPLMITPVVFYPGMSRTNGLLIDESSIQIFHLPQPGMYIFRVTENQGSSGLDNIPGYTVHYDQNIFYLYLVVGFPGGDFDADLEVLQHGVRRVVMPENVRGTHKEYEILFINYFFREPPPNNFAISKTVTGDDGDVNAPFDFGVTLTLPVPGAGETLPTTIQFYIQGFPRIQTCGAYDCTNVNCTDGELRPWDGPVVFLNQNLVPLPAPNPPTPPVPANHARYYTLTVNPATRIVEHSFQLRHGDVITFLDLPLGTTFTVREAYEDYYRQSVVVVTGGHSVAYPALPPSDGPIPVPPPGTPPTATNVPGERLEASGTMQGSRNSVAFTNHRETEDANVTVSKIVTGNMADPYEDFDFTIFFTGGEPPVPLADVQLVYYIYSAAFNWCDEPVCLCYISQYCGQPEATCTCDNETFAITRSTVTLGATGSYEFTLRHNQTITFRNVPADVFVRVVEDEVQYYETWIYVDGTRIVRTTENLLPGDAIHSGNLYTRNTDTRPITEDGIEIEFVNHLHVPEPMGVRMAISGVVLLVGAGALAFGASLTYNTLKKSKKLK